MERSVTKCSVLPESTSSAMGENLVAVGAFHSKTVAVMVKRYPVNAKTEATLSLVGEHEESMPRGSNGAARP